MLRVEVRIDERRGRLVFLSKCVRFEELVCVVFLLVVFRRFQGLRLRVQVLGLRLSHYLGQDLGFRFQGEGVGFSI